MRRKSLGEQKATAFFAAERLIGLPQAYKQFRDDPIIFAMFRYLLGQTHFNAPVGVWIRNRHRDPRGIFSPSRFGIFIPYPQEVQACCKKISPKRALGYGGYWQHCLSIKHYANKFGVPERLLRQTTYYYKKLKGPMKIQVDSRPSALILLPSEKA